MAYKYLEIREKVIAQARRSPGNRLPSEHEVCRIYGVSRTTAIKALNSLAADRLVRREAGRGTFLVRRRVSTPVRLLVNRHDRGFARVASQLMQSFTAANPDVEVAVEQVDATQWIREIITRPGMKVVFASHVGYLSEIGVLQPLHALPGFAQLRERLLEPFVAWRRGRDGAPLCDSLPLMLTPDALLINRGLAEALGCDADRGPSSWGELADWAQRARREPRHGQPAMGASIIPGGRLPMSYLLTANRCRPVIREEGGTVVFDGEAVAGWLGFFRDLHRGGSMPAIPAGSVEPALLGNALFALNCGPWAVAQGRELGNGERCAVLPIPPPAAGQPSCSEIGGLQVALVRNQAGSADELDAAWRLAQYAVGDLMAQRQLVRSFSSLSVLRELHAEQRSDPGLRPFIDLLPGAVLRNDHPLQHGLMRFVHACFHRCVLDDLPVAHAAERIAESCALQIEAAGM